MIRCAKNSYLTSDLCVADGEVLPFRDNTFDAVVSNFGVPFFSDTTRGLKQASRVLKPNGVLAFTSWVHGSCPAFAVIRNSIQELFPESIAAPSSEVGAGYRMALQQEGFQNIVETDLVHVLEGKSAEWYWRRMTEASPGTMKTLAKLTLEERVQLQHHVISSLSGQFGSGRIQLPATARISIGRKETRMGK